MKHCDTTQQQQQQLYLQLRKPSIITPPCLISSLMIMLQAINLQSSNHMTFKEIFSRKPSDELAMGFMRLHERPQSVVISIKVCSFWSCRFQVFAGVNASAHGKALSLSYHVIVVFEQFIPFIKDSFSR